MKERQLRTELAELNESALILEPDYYDKACVGFAERHPGNWVAVYDADELINATCTEEEMTYEEAVEYVDFNILGAWLGDCTPIYLQKRCPEHV